VRMASCKALRSLADESMLPALADLLVAAITSDERNELEQTTSVVALRCASANAAAEVLAGKLGKSADADASLLTVLTKRSGTKALEAVRKCVAGTNLEQKKAAVRAMSSWADTTPLKDLMAVAKDDADTSCRVLALRGYVRLVSDSNEPVGWKMKMFEVALAAAKQPDSVKQVLSGLSNVKEVVALKMVMTQLDNTAVANEAAASALSISQELVNRKKAEDKIIVKAITKIKESASINEGLQKQAAELLKKLPQNVATKKP